MTDAVELLPVDEDSYYQDPMGFFARLRESRPVAPVWMPGYGRVWIVTRHADVRVALTDPRLANKICPWPGGGRSFPDEAAGVHALLNTDPPDHTRLRPLVQKAFTPRRAGQLRPRTKQIAVGLLDELAARGGVVDLLGGYARPLPITVICELLGIPVAGSRPVPRPGPPRPRPRHQRPRRLRSRHPLLPGRSPGPHGG